jgi:hypothetical protein
MKTGDEVADSMFDEIVEVKVAPDGTVEATLIGGTAEEMQNAVEDFIRSTRQFESLNVPIKSPLWWKHLQYLALADSRLKECFCGRDFSPRSVKLYHEWKLKLLAGKRLRSDA